MNLKSKIEKIARATAIQAAGVIFQVRNNQYNGGGTNNVGEVTAVNGNQITMKVNGNKITVPNVGGRVVGKGDKMVTDGTNFAF